MGAPPYLPRAFARAMALAVAMTIAMASLSAAEDGPPTFASLDQSTWIQPPNSVSGTTPSRAPLRRLFGGHGSFSDEFGRSPGGWLEEEGWLDDEEKERKKLTSSTNPPTSPTTPTSPTSPPEIEVDEVDEVDELDGDDEVDEDEKEEIDVDYDSLKKVGEAHEPEQKRAKEKAVLQEDSDGTKVDFLSLEWQCKEEKTSCPPPPGGTLQETFNYCLTRENVASCPGGNFTGVLQVSQLKNRCYPEARRLVYRMPEPVIDVANSLISTTIIHGNKTEVDFHLQSIHLPETSVTGSDDDGDEQCHRGAKVYGFHEKKLVDAKQACDGELGDPVTTGDGLALTVLSDGFKNENSYIGKFPFNKSSLIITEFCSVHEQIEAHVNFTFQFTINFLERQEGEDKYNVEEDENSPFKITFTVLSTTPDPTLVITTQAPETMAETVDQVGVQPAAENKQGNNASGGTAQNPIGGDKLGGGNLSGGSGGTSPPRTTVEVAAVGNGISDQGNSDSSSSSSSSLSTTSPSTGPTTTVKAVTVGNGDRGQGAGTITNAAGEEGTGEPPPPQVTPAPDSLAPPKLKQPETRTPKPPAPTTVAGSSAAAASPLRGALSVASGLSLGLIVLLTMGVTRY